MESKVMEILAQSDEFVVKMDDAENVDIVDGEWVIRLSMPYEVWKSLIDDAIIRQAM
jgi:hypothetical protein